jgi:hypothetical protein
MDTAPHWVQEGGKMSDAIRVALESAIRTYEAMSPSVMTVERKQAIDALQALQSGEPVGVIDNSMRAGVQLTEAGESLPHGTKLYTTPQWVVDVDAAIDFLKTAQNHCALNFSVSAERCIQRAIDLLSAGKGGE